MSIHVFFLDDNTYWSSVYGAAEALQLSSGELDHLKLPSPIDKSKALTDDLEESPYILIDQARKENNFSAFFRYLKSFRKHLDAVYCVKFTPDNQTLISASGDHTIKLWNAQTGKEILTLEGHVRAVMSLAISSSGKILASGSADHTIKLWDLNTGQLIQTLEGHNNSILSLTISANGKILASGSADHTIKLWDLNTGQLIRGR